MPCSKTFLRLANICIYIAKGYPDITKKDIRTTLIKQLIQFIK